jgi:hypothetical protein
MRLRIWVVVGLRPAISLDEGAGEYAARVVFACYGTKAAFALLDRLLEAAPLADLVETATEARVAATIRQLAGEAKAAEGENGGQRAHHNGHAGHLGGGYPRQGYEEDIEDDHAYDGDPERDAKPAEHPHDRARVP